MSIFDGRKVVSALQKDFVKGAWTKIRSKLVDLNVDHIMGMDISPLKNLLDSFFKLDSSYDQARSSLANKALELEKSESYLKAREHLDIVLNEKNKKSKESKSYFSNFSFFSTNNSSYFSFFSFKTR
ncbi:hypothetical protein R3W88_026871 [Solanum pinnatisectum]|uniref:Uncharacterized protein n=1 Tax=Solanum pinnatisectum TaxID=50273 RepID=A0AAV9LI78_9SOLN|nr:hypothetical protein R3W88_026871 [Solanum pinnatisectum]